MREVTPETAPEYAREVGLAPPDARVAAEALGWGVSNVVIRVEVEGRAALVLKQSRERLRTRADWFSRLDRIWTEAAALRLLAGLLPDGAVPAVVFEDRPNYLFAMTCAPADSRVWKELLLAGEAEPDTARRAGALLGAMHAGAAGHPALDGELADATVFDELRIDPFYRTVARAHADLADRLAPLIDPPAGTPGRTFVHADFSPKNLLVHAGGLTVVDFETAHAGDPAFDLGFFLSHLLLKAIRAATAPGPGPEAYRALTRDFWASYRAATGVGPRDPLVGRSIAHAAACCLARVDGKSPVDYLDEPGREAARRLGRSALLGGPRDWDDLLAIAVREVPASPSKLDSGMG